MTEVIDESTFAQLLEIDDFDFAKGIVDEYFQQAEDVIKQLETLYLQHNWIEIGRVGHHLKGSSAAVGAAAVRDLCDDIQHYETTTKGRDPAMFLKRKIDSLKAAFPAAKYALSQRLSLAAN